MVALTTAPPPAFAAGDTVQTGEPYSGDVKSAALIAGVQKILNGDAVMFVKPDRPGAVSIPNYMIESAPTWSPVAVTLKGGAHSLRSCIS